MLVVQEFYNWLPAVPVVHVVAKSGSVNDRQADLEELLLQLGLGDLDLNRLVNLLGVASAVIGVVLDGCAEEGVDEGGLSQAGFASNHDGEGSTALGHNLVALVWELLYISMRADVLSMYVIKLTLAMPIGESVSAIIKSASSDFGGGGGSLVGDACAAGGEVGKYAPGMSLSRGKLSAMGIGSVNAMRG
jgi:hypothetical protein